MKVKYNIGITMTKMKFFTRTAKYTSIDCAGSKDVLKEPKHNLQAY
jgi:hypothetical protein